jgi:hypothetical protein
MVFFGRGFCSHPDAIGFQVSAARCKSGWSKGWYLSILKSQGSTIIHKGGAARAPPFFALLL